MIAEHGFQAAVAALNDAALGKHDAGGGIVENCLLFQKRLLERILGAFAFGDVLRYPERALGQVRRIKRPAIAAAPDDGTILTHEPDFAAPAPSRFDLVVSGAAKGLVCFIV